MTEEEKAEKYVNETFGRTNPIVAMTYINIYLEGHEEGRKEGYEQGYEDCRHYAHDYYKPKWHEIKYCSQDLPPRSKDNHLHSVIVSNEYGEPIYYDYNIDEWCDMEGDVVSEGYKYWCELPKFEE